MTHQQEKYNGNKQLCFRQRQMQFSKTKLELLFKNGQLNIKKIWFLNLEQVKAKERLIKC
jgi:hypothetical protein